MKKKTLVATRHQAALAWLKKRAPEAVWCPGDPREHLVTGESVRVIGTLPLYLAAEVCAHEQSEFWFLVPDIPEPLRGWEMTEKEFEEDCNPRLRRYIVSALDTPFEGIK